MYSNNVQTLISVTFNVLNNYYANYSGMQHLVIFAAEPYGLGLNETLMPQYLKQLGYATHGVGKVRNSIIF